MVSHRMKGAGGSGYRSRFPDPQEDAPQSSRVQTGLGEVLAASSVRAETGPEGCGSRLRGDTPVLTTSRIPEARTSREDVCAAGPGGGAGGEFASEEFLDENVPRHSPAPPPGITF